MVIGQLSLQKLQILHYNFDFTTAQLVINCTLNYALHLTLWLNQNDVMTSEIKVLVWRNVCYLDNEKFLGKVTKGNFFVSIFHKVTDEIIPLEVESTPKVMAKVKHSRKQTKIFTLQSFQSLTRSRLALQTHCQNIINYAMTDGDILKKIK